MSSSEKFERDFEAFLKQDGDSQLAALYRKLPQAEPDAKLDAAVLAMAHRALNPQLVATPGRRDATARRHVRWLPALSAVATAVFAIGVAVKMGPQLWSERRSEVPAAANARDENVVHVRPIEAPLPPPPPASPPPPPALSNGLAAPARQEASRTTAAKPAAPPASAPAAVAAAPLQKSAPSAASDLKADADLDRAQAKKVESVPPPRVAPQAFPSGPRQPEMDSVERKQAIAEGAWQRLHDNEPATGGAAAGAPAPSPVPVTQQQTTATAAARETAAPVPGSTPAKEQPGERDNPARILHRATHLPPNAAPADARSRADDAASPLETQTVTGQTIQNVDIDSHGKLESDKAKREAAPQEFSAATIRNSRLYPESWVAVIQRLIRDGKRDDARQNLLLFRQKYPAYRLPADLERFAREAH